MSRTNLVHPTCNAKQPHRPLRCPPQELLRRHVLKLLRIWRGWFIFSDDYLNGLQARGSGAAQPELWTAEVVQGGCCEESQQGSRYSDCDHPVPL